MAVELKIKVQENCDSLYLFDITGKYDKKCNDTGWCTPNAELSAATSAEYQIFLPNASSPIIIDVFPDFPVSDGAGYEIIAEDLGLENLPSGIWRFDYLVRINGVLNAVSCSKILVEDLTCCIGKKTIEINPDNFESKEVIESNDLNALFESAKLLSKEGKTDKAQKIIDYLYNKCKCSC